jgi:hypothetical protein
MQRLYSRYFDTPSSNTRHHGHTPYPPIGRSLPNAPTALQLVAPSSKVVCKPRLAAAAPGVKYGMCVGWGRSGRLVARPATDSGVRSSRWFERCAEGCWEGSGREVGATCGWGMCLRCWASVSGLRRGACGCWLVPAPGRCMWCGLQGVGCACYAHHQQPSSQRACHIQLFASPTGQWCVCSRAPAPGRGLCKPHLRGFQHPQ